MWFIFPQIAGLGQSPTARNFALSSLAEAQAYINHPVLGQRLHECTRLVNLSNANSIEEIFGYPDNLKFHSCMTLFACASSKSSIFDEALQKYFEGQGDPLTLDKIEK
jgi:uncharacterized protein (DUF1810 family)